MIRETLIRIWISRYVLISLVKRDLQLKYRRSILGVAWSVLMPLGLALVVGAVYSIVLGNDPKTFIPLLFASINPWTFLSGTADAATVSLVGAEGYIKQTAVPCEIYPLRTVMVNFVNLGYTIITFFFLYLFINPGAFGIRMLMLIPGLAIMFFFAWGIANISAMCNLFVRDYQPLQSVILQGFFYATPIIFPAELLAERGFAIIYQVNPFYYMLEVVRRPMMGSALPSAETYIIACTIALVVFLFGIRLIATKRDKVVFYL